MSFVGQGLIVAVVAAVTVYQQIMLNSALNSINHNLISINSISARGKVLDFMCSYRISNRNIYDQHNCKVIISF